MEERYNNPKSPTQRIQARLGNDKCGRETHDVTTQPTRTVTRVYPAGYQSNLHGRDKITGGRGY